MRNVPYACGIAVALFLVMPAMAQPTSQEVRAKLIARLQAVQSKVGDFGPAYQKMYQRLIPWYEQWGSKTTQETDSWSVEPNMYAAELADALEGGKNFIADNAGASFPLVFEMTKSDGTVVQMNYTINLADGFEKGDGTKYPLIVGLHGSGWLAHRISYSRGNSKGGALFSVTPINEGGAWQIDVLNAFLDDLLAMFPIDPERVYVEGHKLGAHGTWDWAMANPERIAAISPRSGSGAMFRAIRVKHVPAWVIHGSEDETVLSAYAEQMVTAMQKQGSEVKYSLLKGVGHNMPADLDQKSVVEWYLQHKVSKEPAPPDPVDSLGISSEGYSPTQIVTLPEGKFWKSDPVSVAADFRAGGPARTAERALYAKIQSAGALVDSLVIQQVDPIAKTTTQWLAVPTTMALDDKSIVTQPARSVAHFYIRGDLRQALDRAKAVGDQLKSEGKSVGDSVWVTQLIPRRRAQQSIVEVWIDLK